MQAFLLPDRDQTAWQLKLFDKTGWWKEKIEIAEDLE